MGLRIGGGVETKLLAIDFDHAFVEGNLVRRGISSFFEAGFVDPIVDNFFRSVEAELR